jgi:hypothetical protein
MSSDLYWLPPPKDQKKNYIGYLKYEIGRYFDKDYNGDNMDRMVGEEIIPFLRGIIAVGSKEQMEDAQKLINAIEKHGEVQLIIGW